MNFSSFAEIEIMVITIKRSDSKKTIARKLKDLPEKKGFEAFKYHGKIRVEGDRLEIQKQMRDGWKKIQLIQYSL